MECVTEKASDGYNLDDRTRSRPTRESVCTLYGRPEFVTDYSVLL